tara:strand:+ start:28219 stop:29280 length:1062 start_codon:yes stop_codon:yes gene_type:complete
MFFNALWRFKSLAWLLHFIKVMVAAPHLVRGAPYQLPRRNTFNDDKEYIMTKLKLLGSVSAIACIMGLANIAQAEPELNADADESSQAATTDGKNQAAGNNAVEHGQSAGTNASALGSQSGDGGNSSDSDKYDLDNVANNSSTTDDNSDDDGIDNDGTIDKSYTKTYTKTYTTDDNSDDDGVDVDAPVNIGNTDDNSDDDGIDVDAPVNIGNTDDNSDDDGIDNDGTIDSSYTKTYTTDDNSDDDGIDNDGTIDKSKVITNTDNSDDDGLDFDLTMGDVAVNQNALYSSVSGNYMVYDTARRASVTMTTGDISETSLSNARGITQINQNTGIASQTNNVSISAKVDMGSSTTN